MIFFSGRLTNETTEEGRYAETTGHDLSSHPTMMTSMVAMVMMMVTITMTTTMVIAGRHLVTIVRVATSMS